MSTVNTVSGPNIIPCESFQTALTRASEDALSCQGRTLAANAYRQGRGELGPRWFLVTAMGLPGFVGMTHIDPVKKGSDPAKSHNRPLDNSHRNDIREYIQTEERYILPAFMVCTQTKLNFYRGYMSSDSAHMFGFVVIPNDALFYIQDGQHRREAAEPLVVPGEVLHKDGAAVVIAVEDDLSQIHQDFADCATTKPISQALLVAYNQRDPLSNFLREVVESVPVFKDRIEKTQRTIGKNSNKAFTTNNLRQAIATLLAGDRMKAGRPGESSHEQVGALLKPGVRDITFDKVIRFFNTFSENNSEWRNAKDSAPESDVVSIFRQSHLTFSATGLLVISEVGHDILAPSISDPTIQVNNHLIRKMASEIDWSRCADIWKGNIVQGNSVLNQSRSLLSEACNAVRKVIGLPPKAPKRKKNE